jgi:hypothetical protein
VVAFIQTHKAGCITVIPKCRSQVFDLLYSSDLGLKIHGEEMNFISLGKPGFTTTKYKVQIM